MMEMESQFVSFTLSKKLYEMDINFKSLVRWFHLKHIVTNEYNIATDSYFEKVVEKRQQLSISSMYYLPEAILEEYPAYSVAELMELIPAYIDTKTNQPYNFYNFSLLKKAANSIRYIPTYVCDSTSEEMNHQFQTLKMKGVYGARLSDALAILLIYLIENKLVEKESLCLG
jgi:hypothetical protein